MATSKEKEAALQADSITQIANVSTLLRRAISAAIPVAPDQYMTIAIPGTVIDVRELKDGGSFIYSAAESAFPPVAVRQAEAKLVDKMVPLSNIMVGNTGKSVARSYSRALDGLVPKKATVKTATGTSVNPIRSPGEAGYDAAMKYLTTVDPKTGYTPVDTYIEKQSAWADAQEKWDKAKLDAQRAAETKYPDDVVKQRRHYDEWNQAHYRKYKFATQGRWMDWVSNGHKYDVEFNFGMVDTESIMARVESSKESLRNSTLVDADGANEVYGVSLTPKNWATLCKLKQEGWFKRYGQFSLEQLDAEILRLEKLQTSYEMLKAVTTGGTTATFPINNPEEIKPGVDDAGAKKAMADAFRALYDAESQMGDQVAKLRKATTQDDKDKIREAEAFKGANQKLSDARAALVKAIRADTDNHAAWNKYNIASLKGDAKASMSKWIEGTLKTIQGQIDGLKAKRVLKLAQQPIKTPAIASASTDSGGNGTIVAAEGEELADSLFDVPPPAEGDDPNAAGMPLLGDSDPFVTITTSFSALDQTSTASSSSWGMSVGAGFGWFLWSAGGSYAHEESRSDAQTDMANCDVSVTFEALVVNIDRPWLYGELFDDFELDVADNIRLSPGPNVLRQLMAQQSLNSTDPKEVAKGDASVISQLAQYNSFPAYPTSFIVAANTIIDFKGDTQHIEDHFSASSDSGSVSVGWGPFSVSSSFHRSSTNESHQLQVTATGCRLSFGAPQIIGWVNQILPALPRPANVEPMVQNEVSVMTV